MKNSFQKFIISLITILFVFQSYLVLPNYVKASETEYDPIDTEIDPEEENFKDTDQSEDYMTTEDADLCIDGGSETARCSSSASSRSKI